MEYIQEFQVGSTYSDRRGEYKVLSIEADTDQITYSYTGKSEVLTGDIELKRRIHNNIVGELEHDDTPNN